MENPHDVTNSRHYFKTLILFNFCVWKRIVSRFCLNFKKKKKNFQKILLKNTQVLLSLYLFLVNHLFKESSIFHHLMISSLQNSLN